MSFRPRRGRAIARGDAQREEQVTFEVAKYLSVNAGVGYFFVGPYLREANTTVNDQWTQFVMWRLAF